MENHKFLPRIDSKQSVDVKPSKLFDRYTAGNSPHDRRLSINNHPLSSFYSSKKEKQYIKSKRSSMNTSIQYEIQDDVAHQTIDHVAPQPPRLRDLRQSI